MKIIAIFSSCLMLIFCNFPLLNAAITVNPWDFSAFAFQNLGISSNPISGGFDTAASAGGVYGSNSTNALQIGFNFSQHPSATYGLYANGTANINGAVTINGGSSGSMNVGGSIAVTTVNGVSFNGNVVAGGNLTGSSITITGNLTLGGTKQSTSTSVSGTTTQNASYTSPLDYLAYKTYFQQASSYWGGLSGSTVSGSTPTINVGAGRTIINISTSTWSGLSTLTLTGGNSSSSFVIINLTGGGANFTLLPNTLVLAGGQLSKSNVLINYLATSTVTVGSGTNLNLDASILAPSSTVIANSSSFVNIGGNLIANNIEGAYSVQGPDFIGFQADQTNFTVPEPSTYLSLGSMLLGILLMKIFKSQKSKVKGIPNVAQKLDLG